MTLFHITSLLYCTWLLRYCFLILLVVVPRHLWNKGLEQSCGGLFFILIYIFTSTLFCSAPSSYEMDWKSSHTLLYPLFARDRLLLTGCYPHPAPRSWLLLIGAVSFFAIAPLHFHATWFPKSAFYKCSFIGFFSSFIWLRRCALFDLQAWHLGHAMQVPLVRGLCTSLIASFAFSYIIRDASSTRIDYVVQI